MLKLTQLSHEVKNINAAALVPNPNHPMGQGLAYRQLKEAGWVCHDDELHPKERVPVFRLDPSTGSGRGAAIRRNKSQQSYWLVEIDGVTYEADGSAAEVTAKVKEMLAARPEPDLTEMEPLPGPASAAARIAADILRAAPYLNGRVEAGLALYEAGQREFPKYKTCYHLANGGTVNRECDCPDAQHRGFRAEFGRACKHTICQEIAWRIEREFNQVAQRKVVDQIEQRRQREQALPATGERDNILDMLGYSSVEEQKRKARAALGPALVPGGGGPLNRPKAQFEVRYGR